MNYKINFDEEEIILLESSLIWLKDHSNHSNNIALYKSMLKKINTIKQIKLDNTSHMLGVSDSGLKLYLLFKKEYNKDLYHSITAVLNNIKNQDSNITKEEFKKLFFDKYKLERKILHNHEEALYEIIDHVFNRLNKKKQL